MSEKVVQLMEKFGGAPHSKRSLRLWLRLLSCTTLIEKRLRNNLTTQFDSTLPRFDILAALTRNPAGLTMGELSRQLLVSNGNVTGVVGKLVDDGLVERTRSPSDGRTFFVRLTRKGHRAFKEMARAHEAWIDEAFADLGNDEIDQLTDLLARVIMSARTGNEDRND